VKRVRTKWSWEIEKPLDELLDKKVRERLKKKIERDIKEELWARLWGNLVWGVWDHVSQRIRWEVRDKLS